MKCLPQYRFVRISTVKKKDKARLVQIRPVSIYVSSAIKVYFSGNLPAPPWACFDTNLQYVWHKPLSLQSNQVRKVDRKLLIALVSQLTFLRVIVEITLILLSQYAGSKGI